MSGRGKAGYVCMLHRDACALAQSVDDINAHAELALISPIQLDPTTFDTCMYLHAYIG